MSKKKTYFGDTWSGRQQDKNRELRRDNPEDSPITSKGFRWGDFRPQAPIEHPENQEDIAADILAKLDKKRENDGY